MEPKCTSDPELALSRRCQFLRRVTPRGRVTILEADQKAVEILRAMGHAAPRQALALALRALSAASPRPKEDPGGLLASHPGLDDRLAALEPLEAPLPLASRPGAGPAK